MNKVAYFILLVIIALFGCKKKENHQTIDADIIANFNYKPGTYWIYKDSLSGREDSFYVTSNTGTQSINNNDTWIDDIGIFISEKSTNSSSLDSAKWVIGLYSNYLSLQWQVIKNNKTIDEITYPVFITYPFVKGPPTSKQGGGMIGFANVANIFPNYAQNGQNYYNVAQLNQYYTLITAKNYNDWFYINESIGIIKMSLDHPNDTIKRVWEIERWKIVK
jgi:hypothetical protein